MESLVISEKVTIDASPDVVWNALTDPNLTKSYMYNCEAISSWEIGSSLIWKGAEDKVIYVKGHVKTFIQEQELGFTVFDPNQAYEDHPRNYLNTKYTLEATTGGTILSVTQNGFEEADNGKERYQHTLDQGGWGFVLQGIKKLVETTAN